MAPSSTTIEEQYATSLTLSQRNKTSLDVYYGHEDGTKLGKQLIQRALHERVKDIDTNVCEPGEEDGFYVADMGYVYRQHLRWKKCLPRVKPHYAVKCNPDPAVISLLAGLGAGFDCASKAEIDQVLSAGVEPSRVIYAQPCKTRSFVRHAAMQNVKQMTFDNTDELYKIAALFPGAELYLRIQTDDSSSLCQLSVKFGAPLDDTQGLLALARQLRLNVVGVSFHVGSGASDPACFINAVHDARNVFDQAASLGYDMHTLDVGGGFTSDLFEPMAEALSEALETYFPSPDVRIIGEPGRYFVSGAYTLACNVIARREVRDPENGTSSYMLYLNDGVYGNFSSIIFDHQHPEALILYAGAAPEMAGSAASGGGGGGVGTEYSIWGPTCDGIDRITAGSVRFDVELNVGDWLYFEEMGAYTKCSATRFNGFRDDHEVVYVCSEVGARALMKL